MVAHENISQGLRCERLRKEVTNQLCLLPDTQLDSIGTVQGLCHARKGKKLCPQPHVVDQIWKVVISRRTVLPILPRAKLQKPGVGSAALLRKSTPGHSPCHHHHPLPPKLLGCSTRRPSTQRRRQSQNQKTARIWSRRRRMTRRRQTRLRNSIINIRPSRSGPSPKLEGC